jgi:hypothetical protein
MAQRRNNVKYEVSVYEKEGVAAPSSKDDRKKLLLPSQLKHETQRVEVVKVYRKPH